MKKLIRGIVDFRRTRRPEYAETFARLALGQKPDALFIACSDSRVVPNLFASTEPGDLFVLRNVGNILAPAGSAGVSQSDESEGAALEFAIRTLKVGDIVVCGHSECGAMRALAERVELPEAPHLKSWLRHAEPARSRYESGERLPDVEGAHNQISQFNTLLQLEYLRTYPPVREAEAAGTLGLHAWWFDIARADVQAWMPDAGRFVSIDERSAAEILRRTHGR